MSRNSVQDAVDALEAALTGASGITRTYDFEPATVVDRSLTIVCRTADADFYNLEARIYIKVGDAKAAQEDMYALQDAVAQQLENDFGPSGWEFGYDTDNQVLVATLTTTYGRSYY